MPLAGIDEEHLARSDLALIGSIIEMQVAHGDDQRHRYRIAMVRNVLSRLQSKADHAHRAAIGDLLESKGALRSFRALC